MSKLRPLKLDPKVDPWERQPDESLPRYSQFCTYRDLGRGRTLRKTAEILTKNDRYVRDVAVAFRWRERVDAYDSHMDRLYQVTWVEERRKAAEADARILGAGLGKVAQRLPSLNAADLSAGTVIRLMDVTMRHRRALFGDSASTLTAHGAEAVEQRARINEEQGLLLAEVIRRTADALLDSVTELVVDLAEREINEDSDEEVRRFAAAAVATVRAQWPTWLGQIVPREIAAVTGGEDDG
ncbi:hypothetical protein [Streptosporangium longisporum]|uniref:Uncharacterized protein n=1 Tax=Streptosporangium longisporum TaxID=46187 RepID=A0ABP6KYZ3_9ACTN